MKKLLLFFAFTAICGTLAAQDLIVKRNAETIDAKVLRIGGSEIQYTLSGDSKGPVYTLPTGDVSYIQYSNGRREEFKVHPTTPKRISAQHKDNFPHYQGEISAAYGLGIGQASRDFNTDRVLIETVHGVRLSPYAFIGAGAGLNYYYESSEGESGAGLITAFVNAKGYYPVSQGTHLYLSLDMGASIGMWNYMKDWRDMYTAVGPGVTFGSPGNRMCCDIGIRYQYMGKDTSAILFRIGFVF